ncbi:hypothetical protein ABES02_02190 [Neobacillus pocheonensis]|uniref:hypothetical protein n=1 Tax=Neobacillus pocheonensis TaxID=363869 RepID=UPI003D2BE599
MNTDQETLYFGCEKGYLDIHTLKYRWFGAIWKYQGSLKIVMGYWFGDSASEIRKQIQLYGHTHSCETKDLQEVYSTIRDLQKEQDWKQRSRLSIFAIFKSPWKDVKSGWYILRSRKTYPCYVSAIQKKKLSIWLEHVSVCETEEHLNEFLAKVNQEHNIQLRSLNEDSDLRWNNNGNLSL